jgi:hypothetical protein
MELLRLPVINRETDVTNPSFGRKLAFYCMGQAGDSRVEMMSIESVTDAANADLYTATPPRCYRAMPAQKLEPSTPGHVLGAVATTILALPRAMVLAPALIRRRV